MEWLGPYSSRVYANYIPMPSLARLLANFLSLCISGTLQILICRDSHLTSVRSWPQPVLLKQIEDGPLQIRVWNPKVRPLHWLLELILIHLPVVP